MKLHKGYHVADTVFLARRVLACATLMLGMTSSLGKG
jgi:hypothetical protein